jgi:hypothetical protein
VIKDRQGKPALTRLFLLIVEKRVKRADRLVSEGSHRPGTIQDKSNLG